MGVKTTYNKVWPVKGGEPCAICGYGTNHWNEAKDVPLCIPCGLGKITVDDLPSKEVWYLDYDRLLEQTKQKIRRTKIIIKHKRA